MRRHLLVYGTRKASWWTNHSLYTLQVWWTLSFLALSFGGSGTAAPPPAEPAQSTPTVPHLLNTIFDRYQSNDVLYLYRFWEEFAQLDDLVNKRQRQRQPITEAPFMLWWRTRQWLQLYNASFTSEAADPLTTSVPVRFWHSLVQLPSYRQRPAPLLSGLSGENFSDRLFTQILIDLAAQQGPLAADYVADVHSSSHSYETGFVAALTMPKYDFPAPVLLKTDWDEKPTIPFVAHSTHLWTELVTLFADPDPNVALPAALTVRAILANQRVAPPGPKVEPEQLLTWFQQPTVLGRCAAAMALYETGQPLPAEALAAALVTSFQKIPFVEAHNDNFFDSAIDASGRLMSTFPCDGAFWLQRLQEDVAPVQVLALSVLLHADAPRFLQDPQVIRFFEQQVSSETETAALLRNDIYFVWLRFGNKLPKSQVGVWLDRMIGTTPGWEPYQLPIANMLGKVTPDTAAELVKQLLAKKLLLSDDPKTAILAQLCLESHPAAANEAVSEVVPQFLQRLETIQEEDLRNRGVTMIGSWPAAANIPAVQNFFHQELQSESVSRQIAALQAIDTLKLADAQTLALIRALAELGAKLRSLSLVILADIHPTDPEICRELQKDFRERNDAVAGDEVHAILGFGALGNHATPAVEDLLDQETFIEPESLILIVSILGQTPNALPTILKHTASTATSTRWSACLGIAAQPDATLVLPKLQSLLSSTDSQEVIGALLTLGTLAENNQLLPAAPQPADLEQLKTLITATLALLGAKKLEHRWLAAWTLAQLLPHWPQQRPIPEGFCTQLHQFREQQHLFNEATGRPLAAVLTLLAHEDETSRQLLPSLLSHKDEAVQYYVLLALERLGQVDPPGPGGVRNPLLQQLREPVLNFLLKGNSLLVSRAASVLAQLPPSDTTVANRILWRLDRETENPWLSSRLLFALRSHFRQL